MARAKVSKRWIQSNLEMISCLARSAPNYKDTEFILDIVLKHIKVPAGGFATSLTTDELATITAKSYNWFDDDAIRDFKILIPGYGWCEANVKRVTRKSGSSNSRARRSRSY